MARHKKAETKPEAPQADKDKPAPKPTETQKK